MNADEVLKLVPLAIAVASLIGSVVAIRAARPKTIAEAKQAEAHATLDLLNGFNTLLLAKQEQIADLRKRLGETEQRAVLVPVYARRIEELEAELRKAKHALSEAEVAQSTNLKAQGSGSTAA